MEENQYIEHKSYDRIDLKTIFYTLWNKKVLILCITLIAAIVTGLISVFIIPPKYHSRLNIIINMPGVYHTKFGDYDLPITTNEQYIELITSNDILLNTIEDMGYDEKITIEELRNRITIERPNEDNKIGSNSFIVCIESKKPEEASKLAQTIFDNYVYFIDLLAIEGALNFYMSSYNVSLSSLQVSLTSTKEILIKNEALLAVTPQTISQAAAMQELQESSTTSDYIILENIINPNYTKIEGDIIDNKQSISNMEESTRIYNEYLVELDILQDKLISYAENKNYSELEKEFVSITKTNLYLPSAPIVPSEKTSPSNALNVAIGTVLGGMVAVLVVLIKEFWYKEYK